MVADNAPAANAAPGTVEPVVTGLASGSMTVAVPRSMTASLPSFLRLLASHADATYSDAGTLVKEWGISNSTLEVGWLDALHIPNHEACLPVVKAVEVALLELLFRVCLEV